MESSKPAFRWLIADHVRSACNADGAVLLDINKGLCYSLNAVGGRIWQLLESGHSKPSSDDIVEALAREFPEVPREQLALDVESCLRDLEHKALIMADSEASLAKAHKNSN